MEQNSRQVAGVEDDVQKLTSSLRIFQSLVTDADRRNLKDSDKALLDTVKRMAYEIDDVLDERSYEIFKSQLTTRKNKVWTFILSSACYCFPGVNSPHRIAVKIRNLRTKLDAINRHDFQSLGRNDEQVEPNITTSYIDISKVKGREPEKARLVNWLLAGSSELPKLHLISIVGMGGVGKTTLAKLVYNDKTVKAHFDIRIWVCVSKPSDKIRIEKSIFISHASNLVELKDLAVKIRHFIKGKKFLLVLDDVWNEDLMEWRELEDCLMGGSSGSKMLVTTRKEKVAKHMGCTDADLFRIGLLSKKESSSLFCQIAFHEWWSREERENLETIGANLVQLIVERCQGLPLAVMAIAWHLCFKKSILEWRNFLEMELGEIKGVQRHIFGSIWLSYCELPPSLKQCFLYCAIFPRDYRMSKDELIILWMAHGFLKPTEEGRDAELVGHDYFNDLCMRSLFQDLEVTESFNRLDKAYCKIHSILQNFANYMMGKECLYIEVNSAEEVRRHVDVARSDDIYHLQVKLGEKVEFVGSFYSLTKLRSLVVMPPKKDSLIGQALPEIFNRLTFLRSLSLSRCGIESIPSNISNLIHLRWLKLSKNYALKELPETICKLYNLRTLSVNWCCGMIHFPKGVETLINLRHFKNDYTYFLLPKGIGKLSGLRKLPRITIDSKSEGTFSLGDLKNLNNICGSLTIFFMERERDTLVENAKQADLEEKKYITTFSLNFPERVAEDWMQQEDEVLVEALKAPPNLEILRITSFSGTNGPSWIKRLTCLKKLKLWYWSNCEHLPTLANLPCLEYIEFSNFQRVKKVSAEFYQMDGIMEASSSSSSSTAPLFPKLKSLQFMNMFEWEEWNEFEGDEELMPCLSYLSIENCPKLKALPKFIHEKATLYKQIIR